MEYSHFVWKALKQFLLAVRHSESSHFSHSKLYILMQLCFSVFFGQWSSPLASADLADRIWSQLRMRLGFASTSVDALPRLHRGIARAELYNLAATSGLISQDHRFVCPRSECFDIWPEKKPDIADCCVNKTPEDFYLAFSRLKMNLVHLHQHFC